MENKLPENPLGIIILDVKEKDLYQALDSFSKV